MISLGTVVHVQRSLSPDFSALHRELNPRLLAAARSWAPPAQADDVVQETWAAVVSGWDGFEGRSKVSTWVFGILRRQSARRWSDSQHVPLASDRSLADDSPWADPPRLIVSRIEAEHVLDVVAELPDRYREIIVLRDLQGYTSEEVASELSLSSGNQRVLLHRARKRVQDELAKSEALG